MVPVTAYAPPPPPSDSLIAPPPRDFVDTDYAARLDRVTGAINITAPPSGVLAVGGSNSAHKSPSLINDLSLAPWLGVFAMTFLWPKGEASAVTE